MIGSNDENKLLSPIGAAHHLGITSELLFQYTKKSFARTSGLRALATVDVSGKTHFTISELDAFDAILAGPWAIVGSPRSVIPKAILDHLRAESLNQCARCGSGIGVDTAHIRSWAQSRSHHHANLIRLCSACHREHDAQQSLSTDELISLKSFLIERTRVNLSARMQSVHNYESVPHPSTRFVGRERELASLIDALRSGRSVIVTGIGGIGKTELLVQALRRIETGRPVVWVDAERHRTASDMLAALQTYLGRDGIVCPESTISARLDALQACVVFDGIDRATLEDIDEYEDLIAAIYSSTTTAQFVATSQIVLHKFSADTRLKIGKLDQESSRRLLESSNSEEDSIGQGDLGPLLDFCEGHTLTLRLATALIDHYCGPAAALRAIHARGVKAIRLPGRKQQSRTTSLELCLQTAYDALPLESRQFLWAIAESPAGLLTHFLEGNMLELPDPIEALAELRRWNLVNLIPLDGNFSRTQMLGPVRAFAIECARREDPARYEMVLDRLVLAQSVMVAVLEFNYDKPEDTAHALQRYGDELPNLLHILNLARANQANTQMSLSAVLIVKSLMRYFFVLGLSEQGMRVMQEATELALSAGHLDLASGLVLQLINLAQRADSAEVLESALTVVDRLEGLAEHGEISADIAMCRGMAASATGDHAEAASFAEKAAEGYRDRLSKSTDCQSLEQNSDRFRSSEDNDHSNDLSGALNLLGFSLLGLGRNARALDAYREALQHLRGGSIAVNRGQILHQIGNCQSYLEHFEDAAVHYFEAAKFFHFIGMEEYLSNALGELGYALLDVEAEDLLRDLDPKVIEDSIFDLVRHAERVLYPRNPIDHRSCIEIIRKLFGYIVLLSLTGRNEVMGGMCLSFGDRVLSPFYNRPLNIERDQEEEFPLLMVSTALGFGLLAVEAEQLFVEMGEVSEEVIGAMIKSVCNAHSWGQHTMRVIDWFSVLLTRRWGYQGASPTRLREFISNYRDDVVDYLELTREGGPNPKSL